MIRTDQRNGTKKLGSSREGAGLRGVVRHQQTDATDWSPEFRCEQKLICGLLPLSPKKKTVSGSREGPGFVRFQPPDGEENILRIGKVSGL